MEASPRQVRQADPETLEISWVDGHVSRYRVFDLRCSCPCAGCVDEVTGKLLLDPARIRPDVKPVQVTGVGNYAIKIVWSDGHDSGIYSFERLRRMP